MKQYKYVIMMFGVLCLASTANAQKNKAKNKPKVVRTELEQPQILMDDVLPATAKLVVVDSVVCSKKDFISHIPLAKDCGRITTYDDFFASSGKKRPSSFVYENEFGDKCFYNDSTKNGSSQLYTAEHLGGKWQAARVIDEFGSDFHDINYPYLMPDGVTLYFSAINKYNSLGERDIYMTRLNSDSMRFYKPENIGLPYNSTANDYMCIIDDINSIGWLVSDRFQPSGKVCVYTFIPSSKRWTDDNPDMPKRKLESLARLSNIKETWTSKTIVDNAKARIAMLKKVTHADDNKNKPFNFVINDKTVYHGFADFKTSTGKELYSQLNKMKASLATDKRTVEILRSQYANAKGRNRKTIDENIHILENGILESTNKIMNLEKKIRIAENQK